ncbi:hypothetical protein [Nocardia fluminea]|uniref:hypothetical protein n=1 Tax=Nocardia fluminea TaxID=134984 RepID=UPI00364BEE66
MNPNIKSSHIAYALATPVVMTDAARRAPVNLLDLIERRVRRALTSDSGRR